MTLSALRRQASLEPLKSPSLLFPLPVLTVGEGSGLGPAASASSEASPRALPLQYPNANRSPGFVEPFEFFCPENIIPPSAEPGEFDSARREAGTL